MPAENPTTIWKTRETVHARLTLMGENLWQKTAQDFFDPLLAKVSPAERNNFKASLNYCPWLFTDHLFAFFKDEYAQHSHLLPQKIALEGMHKGFRNELLWRVFNVFGYKKDRQVNANEFRDSAHLAWAGADILLPLTTGDSSQPRWRINTETRKELAVSMYMFGAYLEAAQKWMGSTIDGSQFSEVKSFIRGLYDQLSVSTPRIPVLVYQQAQLRQFEREHPGYFSAPPCSMEKPTPQKPLANAEIIPMPLADFLYDDSKTSPLDRSLPPFHVFQRLYQLVRDQKKERFHLIETSPRSFDFYHFDNFGYATYNVKGSPHLVVSEGYSSLALEERRVFNLKLYDHLLAVSVVESQFSAMLPGASFVQRNQLLYLSMVESAPDLAKGYTLVGFSEEEKRGMYGLLTVHYKLPTSEMYGLHGVGISIFSPSLKNLRALTKQILTRSDDVHAAVYTRTFSMPNT